MAGFLLWDWAFGGGVGLAYPQQGLCQFLQVSPYRPSGHTRNIFMVTYDMSKFALKTLPHMRFYIHTAPISESNPNRDFMETS